ncbi:MAG: hypothetical protein MHMPM18_004389 [Marteilia pararefringens]
MSFLDILHINRMYCNIERSSANDADSKCLNGGYRNTLVANGNTELQSCNCLEGFSGEFCESVGNKDCGGVIGLSESLRGVRLNNNGNKECSWIVKNNLIRNWGDERSSYIRVRNINSAIPSSVYGTCAMSWLEVKNRVLSPFGGEKFCSSSLYRLNVLMSEDEIMINYKSGLDAMDSSLDLLVLLEYYTSVE